MSPTGAIAGPNGTLNIVFANQYVVAKNMIIDNHVSSPSSSMPSAMSTCISAVCGLEAICGNCVLARRFVLVPFTS